MEVIYIETKLFEKMMNQFNAFTKQVDSLCQKSMSKILVHEWIAKMYV